MTNVVREGGYPEESFLAPRNGLFVGQVLSQRKSASVSPYRFNHALRLVEHADAVFKTSVVRSWENITRQAKLTNSAEALEQWRVHDDDLTRLQADCSPNWIVDDFGIWTTAPPPQTGSISLKVESESGLKLPAYRCQGVG